MSDFFSFVTDGEGNLYYFNSKERKEMIKNNRGDYIDSYSVISSDKNLDPDKVNKYEYNPLTKTFIVVQINTTKDTEVAEKKVRKLNFKTIVPELVIKPIVHPFKDRDCTKVTKSDIKLLSKWERVRSNIWDSVDDSVDDSDRVRDIVGLNVRASVGTSVGDSAGDSVRESVDFSTWDSVRAYISSFFSIKFKFDFSPCVKLWEKGLVPSFDGKTWRLHGGKDARVLFEISKEELKKINVD